MYTVLYYNFHLKRGLKLQILTYLKHHLHTFYNINELKDINHIRFLTEVDTWGIP